MLELDDLATRAVASPVAPPREPQAIRRLARRYARRRRAPRTVGVGSLVAVIAAGIIGLGSPNNPVRIESGSAPEPTGPITRPILEGCAPLNKEQGQSMMSAESREVFAVPAQGASGPLVALYRQGPTPPPSASALVNAFVAGRPAYVAPDGTLISWQTAEGTTNLIRARALTAAELIPVAEAIEGHAALPSGLKSLGVPTGLSWARSSCAIGNTTISVDAITGDAAGRFAYVVPYPEGRAWDDGDTTILVVGDTAALPQPLQIRQATDHEWDALPFPPTTTIGPHIDGST